ncbi:aminoacyl-tRNA hydrolase [Hutsoniella sourekii]|uniref:aminoacyl-tRNA hydrolase n=1 Tax=Hutsoniella sourekii TaxID=87650 RepID=UPI00048257CF|nr:aminoacyl-tRNA hydrolase [Hutsoniella sourekii]
MKLVVGLGNPGEKYSGTRHNIGFAVIDQVLTNNQLKLDEQKFRCDFTIWNQMGQRTVLAEPFTYMNLSGEAVLPLMAYYGIGAEDILVVYDDLDLEPGKLRLRQKGSAGGHNGVKSIIQMLGTDEFNRIKIGIGRPAPGWKVVDHVLASFTKEELPVIDEAISQASQIVEDWADGEDFLKLMNQHN